MVVRAESLSETRTVLNSIVEYGHSGHANDNAKETFRTLTVIAEESARYYLTSEMLGQQSEPVEKFVVEL